MPIKLVPPREGLSPYWRIRGTYLGVKVNESTRAATRAVAAKVLKARIDDIERGRFQKKLGPTFLDAVHRYTRDVGKDKKFIDKLVTYFGDKPLAEITRQAIEDASFALYPNAKPCTRNRQVFTPMSAILRHSDVEIRLKRPKGANGARREFFFLPEQVEAIINHAYAGDAEFGLFLTFLFYTGCRVSEGLSVRVDDVELQHASAFIGKTKNGEPRRVHLPPALVAALANHPRGFDRTGRLFRFHKGSKFNDRLKAVSDAVGVMIPDGTRFHAFRHTFGTYLHRYGGLDTSGLVATGAWKSLAAAERYKHVSVPDAARASDRFPVIGVKKSV
jgi:integrase